MTIPAMAEKPFALIDRRMKDCATKMIRGTSGGDTPENRYLAYQVQVALYTELERLRQELEAAFKDDEEED